MLYNQPLATRFGSDLQNHLSAAKWTSLDIAVAWVRRSGVDHLRSALETFLARSGSRLSIVVGIDLFNTTKEGLEALVALGAKGTTEIYVHYNEAGGIFHPKLYLFKGGADAKLIVGSNNLTESGLYSNTEAGLEVDLPATDATIVAADDALKSWKDTTSGLAKLLTPTVIQELLAEGYIRSEASVRADYSARGTPRKGRRKLFGSVPTTVPSAPTKSPRVPIARKGQQARPSSTATGQALLMRVRKAHERDRPTQTQLPIRVARQAFFSGITTVTSSHNGQSHNVVSAAARGGLNTLKLEIPEMRNLRDPVVRFHKTPSGMQYEVYDSSTPQGRQIMSALNAGLRRSPADTFLTLPSDRTRSTWWRFI